MFVVPVSRARTERAALLVSGLPLSNWALRLALEIWRGADCEAIVAVQGGWLLYLHRVMSVTRQETLLPTKKRAERAGDVTRMGRTVCSDYFGDGAAGAQGNLPLMRSELLTLGSADGSRA